MRVCTHGSSPLARGTATAYRPLSERTRFIPAGAGNSIEMHGSITPETVHPRWRGEQLRHALNEKQFFGSSPLARGTEFPMTVQMTVVRFIPAGAGNRVQVVAPRSSGSVHPRWRGEQMCGGQTNMGFHGSSPLARGTGRLRLKIFFITRFIPAGAGNRTV